MGTGLIKKIHFPLVFAAVFYLFTVITGSRSLCFIYNLYGIPCPGCGLTRAYLQFFKGDVASAFYCHPLLLLPAIILIIFIFKDHGIFKKIYWSKSFWIFTVALFIIIWILRMIVLFPDKEPMNFNNSAFFPNIFRLLTGK